MRDELVRDTARMFAGILMNDDALTGEVFCFNGEDTTRRELLDELMEWESRGACTTDYMWGSALLWGDEYSVVDEFGDMVPVDISPIVKEYFRILATEWAVK